MLSWAYIGVDPAGRLLMGPALAIPKALARARLTREGGSVIASWRRSSWAPSDGLDDFAFGNGSELSVYAGASDAPGRGPSWILSMARPRRRSPV